MIFQKLVLKITEIDIEYLNDIEKFAGKLEQEFKEIRKIKFVVEESQKFWLIDQFTETEKSVRAGLTVLLFFEKVINY